MPLCKHGQYALVVDRWSVVVVVIVVVVSDVCVVEVVVVEVEVVVIGTVTEVEEMVT
jgi:hypothetical protein